MKYIGLLAVAACVRCAGLAAAQFGAVWMTPEGMLGSSLTRVDGGVQAGWLRVQVGQSGSSYLPTIWSGTAASARSLLPTDIGSTAGKVLGLDGSRQVG